MGDGSDNHQRGNAGDEEAPAEQPRIGAVVTIAVDESDFPTNCREDRKTDNSQPVERPALVAQRATHHSDGTPHHGHRSAEQQATGPGNTREVQRVSL